MPRDHASAGHSGLRDHITVRTLHSFARKIEKSLLTRGLVGTTRFALTFLLGCLRNLAPPIRRSRALERVADQAFDRKYAVNTAGFIPLSELDLTAGSWIFGVAYQAVGADVDFEQILREVGVPYEQFAFIDLGSGKGRAILLASAIPFKKIVGVEFSEELNRIAEDNLRRWPDEAKNCKQIALVCMDAVEYCFPDESFVLYMYNPFGRPVMERVVRNVRAAYRRWPRRIVVLYFTPRHARLWDEVEFFNRVLTRPGYCVYDTLR